MTITKPDNRPTLLLTGATGVLGRALIDEFAADYAVVCLRHRSPVEDARVTEFAGDLGAPAWGIGATALAALARRVDVVVHSAALTHFGAGRDETFRANLDGTRAMLAFAATAGAPLYHVSTAFAARHGVACAAADPTRTAAEAGASEDASEDASEGGGEGGGARAVSPSAYLESKIAADAAVRVAVRDTGLGAVIIRPSVICGDSRTGRIANFQGLLTVAGALMRNALPVVPVAADARIDFVPSDLVASSIGRLVRRRVTSGEYWVTAGPAALTVEELIDLLMGLADRLGLAVSRPRLMDADALDRLLLPLLDDLIPAGVRRKFHALAEIMPLFHTAQEFPSSLGEIGADLVTSPDQLAAAFLASMEYWAAGAGLLAEAVA